MRVHQHVRMKGHAIEVRLYAEDPANNYAPGSGVLHRFEIPALPGLRVDTGVASGSVTYTFTEANGTVEPAYSIGGDSFDFALNPHPIVCIWDAGGVDTLADAERAEQRLRSEQHT